MSMIKEAQHTDETSMLIIEKCVEMNVSMTLLEDLGGTMLSYVQMLKAGRGLTHDLAANLANMFAFAELIGAIRNEQNVKPQVASDLLNVYRNVKPGESSTNYQQIQDTIDNLGAGTQQAFRKLANKWGKHFSSVLQNKSPEAVQGLTNNIVQVVQRVRASVERLQNAHGDKMVQNKIAGSKLGQQLGV